MTRTIIAVTIGTLGLAAASAASHQACAQTRPEATHKRTVATEFSAQSRVRPHIRVTPAYPYRSAPYRTYSTDYPVPYKYEYPGPGFVRQCSSRLAMEGRLSGPVLVPHMRCWWQPG
jgi:hypothetical protein